MGSGSGISLYTRLSGPPNFSKTIARITVLQLIGTDSGSEEAADHRRDLRGMRFQREVTRVEEADDGTRNIALERLGAERQEERVVLAPHRQQRRPVLAEGVLERRGQLDIACVIVVQVYLDLILC